MITLVRALWGDEQIMNWPHVMRDAQWYAAKKIKAGEELGCNELIVAFGDQNFRFLVRWGLKPMGLDRNPVIGNPRRRNRKGSDTLGYLAHGHSIWRHKFLAMHYAFECGADGVIWLDWDIIWDVRQKDMLDMLGNQPAFQGRVRKFKVVGPRYGGGCLYFGSVHVLEAAINKAAFIPYADDQTIITLLANDLYFDGRNDVSADEHRHIGIDNPRLYSTKLNAVESDCKPLFTEKIIDCKLPRFAKPLRLDRMIKRSRGIGCLKR